MARIDDSDWQRRRILQLLGFSAIGAGAVTQAGTGHAASSTASVAVDDQETDGTSILITEAETDVSGHLIIISDHQEDGTNINYHTIDVEAGDQFSNEEIELTEPIAESQRIRVEIWESDDWETNLARDDAVVAVGESLNEVVTDPDVEFVEENPDAGFHFPYLLYTPSVPGERDDSTDPEPESWPLLVRCSPRKGSTSERDERFESGKNDIEQGRGRSLADELHVPTVVALIPARDDERSFYLLDHNSLQVSDPPHERLDLQVLAMVEDARDRLADDPDLPPIAEKFHMDGYSSNGEFIEQFALLHPDRVNALSVGGNGAVTLPKTELDDDIDPIGEPEAETLPWPVGVADLEELTGDEFDKEAWLAVDQFRYIGEDDQWDPFEHDHPREYRHSQRYLHLGDDRQELLLEIFGWEQVTERFVTARESYENIGAAAEFEVYEDTGHEVTGEIQRDIGRFHRDRLSETFGSIDTGGDSQGGTGELPTSTDDMTADEQPGFGVAGALTAIGAIGYLLTRRNEK